MSYTAASCSRLYGFKQNAVSNLDIMIPFIITTVFSKGLFFKVLSDLSKNKDEEASSREEIIGANTSKNATNFTNDQDGTCETDLAVCIVEEDQIVFKNKIFVSYCENGN